MMKEKVMAKIPAVANKNRDMEATTPPMWVLRLCRDDMQIHRDQSSRAKRRPVLNRKPAEARVSSTIPHAARRSHRYLYTGSSPLPQPGTPLKDVPFEEMGELLLADWHRQVRGV